MKAGILRLISSINIIRKWNFILKIIVVLKYTEKTDKGHTKVNKNIFNLFFSNYENVDSFKNDQLSQSV